MSRTWPARLLFLVLAGCGRPDTATPLPPGHNILFIGNSLTYVNDLPATVAAIAASAGDTMRVSMAAGANLALIDHLKGSTDAVAQIKRGNWEYVVLQQGPTPRGICRDSLVLWATMFEPHIRAVGAEPALFMTWTPVDQQGWFDDVRVSFQQAAAAVDGIFLPAGEAWRGAVRDGVTSSPYGPDGFHPAPVGTFLAALTIYERLSGRDARTLPLQAFSSGRPIDLPDDLIRKLQQAAHSANTQFPARARPAMLQEGPRSNASC